MEIPLSCQCLLGAVSARQWLGTTCSISLDKHNGVYYCSLNICKYHTLVMTLFKCAKKIIGLVLETHGHRRLFCIKGSKNPCQMNLTHVISQFILFQNTTLMFLAAILHCVGNNKEGNINTFGGDVRLISILGMKTGTSSSLGSLVLPLSLL